MPSTSLTAFFIHIVDVFNRNVKSTNDLCEKVKVPINDRFVEGLSALWIQTRWSSERDLRVTSKEVPNPRLTGVPFTCTESLGLFSNCPLAEWMAGVGQVFDPFDKDLLSLRAEKLLTDMSFGRRNVFSLKTVTQGVVRKNNASMFLRVFDDFGVAGHWIGTEQHACLLNELLDFRADRTLPTLP